MHTLADSFRGLAFVAAGLATLGGALPGAAQSPREIVSKSVSVGSDASSLTLEFDRGEGLFIELDDGVVSIDGEVVGAFESEGPLDEAWRSLLGFAVALDEEPLATALVEWAPPESLQSEAAEVAVRIDEALESAFGTTAAALSEEARADAPVDASVTLRTLVSLLDRTDALAGLAEALDDVELDNLRLSVGEELLIGRDEMVEGSVLVLDGDLEVAGHVRGDVVVVDGDLRLRDGARIDGDVRIADGALVDDGGRLEGEVIRIENSDVEMERRIRDELRSEIRSEIRAAARDGQRDRRGESAFSRVFGGIGGALSHFFSVIVVGLIGAAVVHFAGPNLDAVAETARRTPTRSLMVGTAGAFLILPAFVLGIVALAISIVGIPALILWIPLFPVAVVLGVGLGFLAVFRNIGIWVSRQDLPYLGWVRLTNPVTLVAGGALAMAAPSIAAELVSVFPWTGALEMVLRTSAVVLTAVVGLLGFGSVLLTRAGRKPEFFDDDLFGGWGGRRSRTASTGTDDDGLWSEMEASAAAAGRTASEAMDHAADTVDAAAEAMSAEADRVADDLESLAHDMKTELDDAVDRADEAVDDVTQAVDDALDEAADAVDEAVADHDDPVADVDLDVDVEVDDDEDGDEDRHGH